MSNYEPFNPVHPPLMTDPDTFPESPTQSAPIGEPFNVGVEYFELVEDPDYPWQTMPHDTPESWKKWNEMKQKQKTEVDHYVIVREQNWTRIEERFYPDDTDETWTYKYGSSVTHEESSTEEITEKIGFDLGVKLVGDIFAAPPIEAVSPISIYAVSNEDNGGDKSSLEAKFSYEFGRKLSFTQKDVETYSMERSYTCTEHRKEQCYYLTWQIDERMSISRVKAGSQDPVFYNDCISALEKRTFTDRFSMSGD